MGELKDHAISGVKWQTISTIYSTIVRVLQVAVLARFLDKSDFGLMGIAVLVNSFCSIYSDMGLSAAAMHKINLSKEEFSSFYWFNIFVGFVLTVAVSLCSPIIANFYHEPELTKVISLTSLMIVGGSISSLQRTIQQKKMNFGFLSIVDIISATLLFISNYFFASSGFGVFSLVYSSLIGTAFVALAYVVLALFKEKNILLHFKFSEIKEALKIGIFQVGSSTLDFFSREFDSMIISSSFPMGLFGVYTLCKNVTQKLYGLINPIITNVMTPIFAQLQTDKSKISGGYIKMVNLLGFVNFPLYSVIGIASYSFMSILYGSSYGQYSYILFFMAYFYAFQSLGNPVGSLLVAMGKTDRGFYWTIFRIIFTVIYLYIGSRFSFGIFLIFILCTPFITCWPSWKIMMSKVIDLSFKQDLLLMLKPFVMCFPLMPLYFIDRWINFPLVSFPLMVIVILAGYGAMNYFFRREIFDYFVNTLGSELNKYKNHVR